MAPAFPPGLGGSLPSAYQFVRDPQSGQLVVIPSDHLPHFGKWWPCGGGAVAVVALPGEPDPDAKGLLGGQASAQNNGVGVRPGLLGDVLMSGASPGSNAMVVPVLMGSYSEPKQAAPSWGLAPLPWPPCPGASHSMGVHLVDHRVRWEEELGVPACGRGPPWAGDGARVPWVVIQRQRRIDGYLDIWEGEYTYRCILTNDYKSSARDIVEFYNLRGGKERIFDDMNNDFGWNRLPKSFMAQNTVFLLMTALIRNFYKAIMQRLKTHEFGLRATSRIKTFVFKFISVPAKWIKTSRRHVLNIYSDNNAYALFPLKRVVYRFMRIQFTNTLPTSKTIFLYLLIAI